MDVATQALNKLDEAAGESWLTWEDQPAASPTACIPAEPSSRHRESRAQPAQQPAGRQHEQWSTFGFDDSASESASTGAQRASPGRPDGQQAAAVGALTSAAFACLDQPVHSAALQVAGKPRPTARPQRPSPLRS